MHVVCHPQYIQGIMDITSGYRCSFSVKQCGLFPVGCAPVGSFEEPGRQCLYEDHEVPFL